MATVTTSTSSSISDIEGYSFFGSIMYGDNGDPEGMPEYVVGNSDTNNIDGFIMDGRPGQRKSIRTTFPFH